VREQFIPVSFEIAYVNRRPDAEGRFFREKLKVPSFNGFMAVTPNGRILNGEPYLDLVLKRGLEQWNALPEEERRPGLKLDDLGPVDRAYELAPPPGGLILRASIRALSRDGKGQLYRPAKVDLENPGAPPIESQAQRDHLWLTSEEAAALVPPQATRGLHGTVPAFFTDRLCRFYLKDSATCIPGTATAKFGVYTGRLTFGVEEAAPALLRLRLQGSARGEGPDFRFEGIFEYAPARKAFTRMDLVAYSEKGHVDKKSAEARPLGIAFELVSSEQALERVPPYFFTLERWADSPKAMAEAYFGARK